MGGVAGAHLIHGQVGGDHRPLVRRQAGVDEGVEGGLDEGAWIGLKGENISL